MMTSPRVTTRFVVQPPSLVAQKPPTVGVLAASSNTTNNTTTQNIEVEPHLRLMPFLETLFELKPSLQNNVFCKELDNQDLIPDMTDHRNYIPEIFFANFNMLFLNKAKRFLFQFFEAHQVDGVTARRAWQHELDKTFPPTNPMAILMLQHVKMTMVEEYIKKNITLQTPEVYHFMANDFVSNILNPDAALKESVLGLCYRDPKLMEWYHLKDEELAMSFYDMLLNVWVKNETAF
jgi:hypothetical protein